MWRFGSIHHSNVHRVALLAPGRHERDTVHGRRCGHRDLDPEGLEAYRGRLICVGVDHGKLEAIASRREGGPEGKGGRHGGFTRNDPGWNDRVQ
jgi:hypothetical protein